MIWIIFTSAVFFLLLAYLVYPWYLQQKSLVKKLQFQSYNTNDELPNVAILIAAYNEEKVIIQKLNSILNSNYPLDKIQIIIGLDACTDNTKKLIIENFNFHNINLIEFKERQGKPNILNNLANNHLLSSTSIILLTDADVMFTQNTIFELIKYFKEDKIGLVDANIQSKIIINENEKMYWQYENQLKENESLVYGIIPGPSGGCYAIRKELYTSIPDNFIVDDFFIGFNIVIKKFNTIFNKQAICYENITTNWIEEFKRKTRIATGNFQNLWYFKKYALNIFSTIGIVFVLHKIIRWKTPFLLLIIYYILLLKFTLFTLLVTLFLPIIDVILFTFGATFKPLRSFHYYIVMNIAVFIGFLKFCKGVKTNVWQPTTRN